ncbi:MAG: hypothetical protein Q9183_007769 [Haloplaca sp. 2 TL-2023]
MDEDAGEQRVNEEEMEGDEAAGPVAGNEDEAGGGFMEDDDPNDDGGGGFLPDRDSKEALPTATRSTDYDGGGFMDEDSDEGGGFLPDPNEPVATPSRIGGRKIVRGEDEDDSDSDSDVYMPSDHDKDDDDDVPTRRGQRGTRARQRGVDVDDEGGGGGFIPSPDHDDEGSGQGFIPTSLEQNRQLTEQSHQAQKDSSANIVQASATFANAAAIWEEKEKEKPLSLSSSPPTPPLQPIPTSLAPPTSSKADELHHPPAAQEKNDTAESIFHLTDAEIAEATMLQQMYEGNESPNVNAQSSNAEEPENHEPEQEVEKSIAPQQVVEGNSDDDDDHEDKGSLLSEDPADEDAEPEWLA